MDYYERFFQVRCDEIVIICYLRSSRPSVCHLYAQWVQHTKFDRKFREQPHFGTIWVVLTEINFIFIFII